ncbi:MAG: aldehyde dehydrogenase family protein, partial [Bacteroidota bacterium]|nr:aldehyde dehydrogenase family protein [Bacteroidota bacterium]
QRNIYPSFLAKFTEAVKVLQVGNGAKENVQIGPLINKDAIDKVERLLKDAVNRGAQVVMGGKKEAKPNLFFPPTILTHCTGEMQLSQEEIFGPVSAIYLFDREEEAVALANDTQYGLAAYFFTQNIAKVWRVAGQLQYGMIGINEGLISAAEAPFGGVKQSGYGREGSRYGIDEFLTIKYLCIGNM